MPNDNNWEDHRSLLEYCEFKPCVPIKLRDSFTTAPGNLLEVIDKLLKLYSNERCRVKQASRQQMNYFR